MVYLVLNFTQIIIVETQSITIFSFESYIYINY